MSWKTSITGWWMGATLIGCGALYMAYPNDHSVAPALLGVLVASFFLYSTLRVAVAVSKNWLTAYRRTKR
jgi:hypothetical protein